MTQIDNRESGLSVRTKLNQIFDMAESAVQPADFGTAANEDVGAFATAAQGEKADTAQQTPAEGAFADGDKTKLNGIETGATADQTGAEIKTAYEAEANTNAFTDAEKTKLSGVETNADVTDTANVTAAGALMDSEVTNLNAVKAFDPADYATGAEGDLAATALQPGDAVEQTSATGSAVLPVGTTAQRDGTPSTGYLRYNSTDGSPEIYDGSGWAPVGGGGGGLVFITSSDLSNDATADFTAFDATKYDAYKFVLQNILSPTSSNFLHMRTSTDGGATYDSANEDYLFVQPNADQNLGTEINVNPSGGGLLSSAGAAGLSAEITILGPHLAKQTLMVFSGAFENLSEELARIALAGARRSSADVNAIRFYFSSGNIASGTITMYGMVNA